MEYNVPVRTALWAAAFCSAITVWQDKVRHVTREWTELLSVRTIVNVSETTRGSSVGRDSMTSVSQTWRWCYGASAAQLSSQSFPQCSRHSLVNTAHLSEGMWKLITQRHSWDSHAGECLTFLAVRNWNWNWERAESDIGYGRKPQKSGKWWWVSVSQWSHWVIICRRPQYKSNVSGQKKNFPSKILITELS